MNLFATTKPGGLESLIGISPASSRNFTPKLSAGVLQARSESKFVVFLKGLWSNLFSVLFYVLIVLVQKSRKSRCDVSTKVKLLSWSHWLDFNNQNASRQISKIDFFEKLIITFVFCREGMIGTENVRKC